MKNLENVWKKIIKNNINGETKEDALAWVEDVLTHGCQSGVVSDLIYYSETLRIFRVNIHGLNKWVSEIVSEHGVNSLFDVFPGLDKEDQLLLDCHNQNLLVWAAFEDWLGKQDAERLVEEFIEENND